MKKKRLIIWSIIGFLVLFLVLRSVFKKEEAIRISTEKIQHRTIIETITANGNIQPETEVKISPDVSGEITELYVKEGDDVKQGDLLLKIKPDTYLSALERAEAAVNSAKANYANAQARLLQTDAQLTQTELDFKRMKLLFEKKAISQSDFETSEASYKIAKAEVQAAKQSVAGAEFNIKSAKASLKEARENLTKTTIYAPIAGTISRLNVEKGERVVGTMQMAGTEILRIANMNKMEVLALVNENDIVKVHYNDTAIIEIDAYFERKFKGIVTEIANSADVLPNQASTQVINFEVSILILEDSYKELLAKSPKRIFPLRPGMSATVDIQTDKRTHVKSIPIQAVTTRKTKNNDTLNKANKNNENQEVVFLFQKDKVFVQEVKTGIQDNTFIEIIQGLNDSDEVVAAPYQAISEKLADSMKVNKVAKKDLFRNKKE